MIPESTLAVLRASTFRVDPEPFSWVSAGRVDHPERHLVVVRDDRETTVVTREAELVHVEVLDRNPDAWVLLAIDCANPFYCVGFLAAVTSPFAEAGLDVLALSTFTRDYVFVKAGEVERAREILRAVGVQER